MHVIVFMQYNEKGKLEHQEIRTYEDGNLQRFMNLILTYALCQHDCRIYVDGVKIV